MKKKGILLWVFSLGIIFLNGCETIKGAAYGTGSTVVSATEGIGATACGAAKDTVNLWQAVLKANDWIKENLW